jgi:hypothetical protein
MADVWRDFWIHETGMGQQMAQLHDRYMMMMSYSSILQTDHKGTWDVEQVKGHTHISIYKYVNVLFEHITLSHNAVKNKRK